MPESSIRSERAPRVLAVRVAFAALALSTGSRAASAADTLVEFHNTALDHYFITIDPAEAAAIDAGAAGAGWERTGKMITAYRSATGAPAGEAAVCRFYGNTANGGPNGHFYTADAAECAAVKLDPGWSYERVEFYAQSAAGQACASGSVPVYRVYNGRAAQHDSNHRYTTDAATYNQMVAAGWRAEGVVFCAPAAAAGIDPTRLPLGDGKYTRTTPAPGWLYVCYGAGQGGATSKGSWFNADGLSWNALAKFSVQGSVSWASIFSVVPGATLALTGNGLPSTPTGIFPIAPSDPAYQYDRNPNTISAATLAWGLPSDPQVAATPSCTGLGAIGVLLNGARLFNADDGANRDAVAWEVQDACQGHPQRNGVYHHHSVSTCLAQKDTAGKHSPLVGYIADGFGLYGNLGENGVPLTNADLDECHGHTHAITVNGITASRYHYHQTKEFPYTIGCFRGKPVNIN